MPSDCQCSTACSVEKEVKVISNKKAAALIKRLERELAELKKENAYLKTKYRSAKMNKEALKKKLKDRLDLL